MMKKQYLVGVLGLALSFVMLLAACSPTDTGSTTPTEDPTAQGGTAASESSASAPPAGETTFASGTWLSDAGQYYFFDGDGASGGVRPAWRTAPAWAFPIPWTERRPHSPWGTPEIAPPAL